MMHSVGTHLPAGWSVARISEIAEVNPRLEAPAHAASSTVSFVPMTAVEAETGAIDLSRTRHLSEVRKGYRYFRARDVLFAKITPCMENGKMVVVPRLEHGIGFGSTEFHVLRPHREISPDYLYRFVSAAPFRRDAEHHMTGAVGQRRVPTSYLAEQPIPLPPEKEQRRIAAKIDELFSALEAGIKSLKKARAQLTTYRQAVLKYAFEGKLTANWREENKERLVTREQLLGRISRARVDRYEKQLRDWRISANEWKDGARVGKRPRRPAPLGALSSLPESEIDRLPTLPTGWAYFLLGLLIDEPKYGTSKKCDYDYVGTGVLRIPNVVDGVINTDDLKGAHFEDDDVNTFSLSNGDILMIRSNGSISIVGKSAIVAEADEQYLYAGYLMRLRSNRDVIIPEYLILALGSHFVRMQIEEKAKSTSGVNNINAREVQSLVIPLCSVSEQRVIIKQVTKRLPVIDALDRGTKDQMSATEVLRQAILIRAFSGRLVSQDPNDGAASVFLDRIKAEREQIMNRAMPRKTGRRKKTKVTA